jgi:hypothetical protein
MQIVEFFPNIKGLYLQCHIGEREGSTVALLDFLILISKRPIHQEFSRGEGVHHDQAHEHYTILHGIRYNLSVPMGSIKTIVFSNSTSQRGMHSSLDGDHIYEWLEITP